MEKTNLFSFSRFLQLIKRFITLNGKTWIIGLAAATSLIILIALAQAFMSNGYFNYGSLVNFGLIQLFIGGFIITSLAFKELNSPARSQFFLTLPANALEKLLSHWFVTSVVFVVIANILLAFAIMVSSLFCNLIWSTPLQFFNPLDLANLKIMSSYLILQSIFFLGSVYFRKGNFIKTALSLLVIGMAFMVFTIIMTFVLFGSGNPYFSNNTINPEVQHVFENIIPMIFKIVYFGLLAPFCLLVSYFRIKEREV
ncbi:MAG: hypothetical protein ACOCWC_02895 [Bacteroidota bacterium]